MLGALVSLFLVIGSASGADGTGLRIRQVAVVPIRTLDAPADVRRQVETAVVAGLGPSAIPPRLLRRRLMGEDLANRAEACGYEVACLSELGRWLGADVVVLGSLRRLSPESWGLELIGIDARHTHVIELATWRLEPEELGAAPATLARQVALPPDAEVVLDVEPRGVRVSVYDEPVRWALGAPVPVASGTYRIRLSAPGFESEARQVTVRRGQTERIHAALERDPLHVAEEGPEVEVFRGGTRSGGLGSDVLEAGAAPSERARPVWPRVLHWSGMALAAGLAGAGAAVMVDAQSRYDDLSREVRFAASTTAARAAVDAADAAQGQRVAGNVMLWTGLGLATAGVVWGLLSDDL